MSGHAVNGTCDCPADYRGDQCEERRPYRCEVRSQDAQACAANIPEVDSQDERAHLLDGDAPCRVVGEEDQVAMTWALRCRFTDTEGLSTNRTWDYYAQVSEVDANGTETTLFALSREPQWPMGLGARVINWRHMSKREHSVEVDMDVDLWTGVRALSRRVLFLLLTTLSHTHTHTALKLHPRPLCRGR